jgi:hypothetical protein
MHRRQPRQQRRQRRQLLLLHFRRQLAHQPLLRTWEKGMAKIGTRAGELLSLALLFLFLCLTRRPLHLFFLLLGTFILAPPLTFSLQHAGLTIHSLIKNHIHKNTRNNCNNL